MPQLLRAQFFRMLAFRIFGYFAAGHDYSTDPDAKWMNQLVSNNGSRIIGEYIIIILGLPVWGFIPRIKSLKADVKKLHQHIEMLIQKREKERKEKKTTPENDDPLKGMLDAKLSRKEMYEHLTTLLSAGHHTTAFFGCYMAYLLASHLPEVQRKVKDEVKAVLGNRTDMQPEDAKKMTYTANVMKETLRLYTVIPFVNRTSVKDVKLRDSDVVIPGGTTCLVPLCLMNRDGVDRGRHHVRFVDAEGHVQEG